MCNVAIAQHCLEHQLGRDASAYADGKVHVVPKGIAEKDMEIVRLIRRANFHAGLVTLDPTMQSWPEYHTLIGEMLDNESRNPLEAQVKHFLRRWSTYTCWFHKEVAQLDISGLPVRYSGKKGWRARVRKYTSAAQQHPALASLLERCVRPAHVYVRTVQTNVAQAPAPLPLAA